MDDTFTLGSGNVFADAGLSHAESKLAKADLAIELLSIMVEQGWTQKQAADRFGTDQPKMSAIASGKLRGFSIERLMQMLAHANYDVEVRIVPNEDRGRAAEITVTRGEAQHAASGNLDDFNCTPNGEASEARQGLRDEMNAFLAVIETSSDDWSETERARMAINSLTDFPQQPPLTDWRDDPAFDLDPDLENRLRNLQVAGR